MIGRRLIGGVALVACLAAPVAAQEGGGPFSTRVLRGPGGRPIVVHRAERDAAVVEPLAQIAATFVPEPLATASLPPDTLEIVIAPTESDFFQLTGGRAPDWGLAVAFPKIRRVVMRSPRLTGGDDVDPATILRHELGHVYLDLAVGGSDRVPRWFNEGFSALYADEWRWIDPARLAWARWSGGLTPLARLDGDFAAVNGPTLAYLQSMAAVRSLERRGGERGFRLLTDRVRGGASFDAALRATYGLTLDEFYADWGAQVERDYGWGVALSDDRIVWVLGALLVLGGYIARRLHLRREIERRKAAEDAALGAPDDHSLGVEEWERYWEHDDDDAWRGDG